MVIALIMDRISSVLGVVAVVLIGSNQMAGINPDRYWIWNTNDQFFNSDKLKIINMPVLKTHMQYGVTGVVKGYIGVPWEKLSKNSHSSIGLGGMGTLMAEIVPGRAAEIRIQTCNRYD